MADKTVHIGNINGDFTIDKSNRTYVLDEGKVVASGSIQTDPAGNIDDILLRIDGTVTYDSIGLSIGSAASKDNRIVISDSGVIDAREEGVVASGDGTRISNSGSIFVWNDNPTSIGIQSTGDGARIVNDGFLKAETGFHIHGGTGNVVINSGLLAGYPGTTGIVFDSAAGEKNRFVNSGEMIVSSAVEGGAGNEKVINTGKLGGSVDLGDGNDVLITRQIVGGDVAMGAGNDRVVLRDKGSFSSLDTSSGDDILDLRIGKGLGLSTTISGGMDDDVYIVSSSNFQFEELAGGGNDTVRSSANFNLGDEFERLVLTGNKAIDGAGNASGNKITGNGDSNRILGMAGTDTLDGGRGDDTLSGGSDADSYVFRAHSGRDLITDFADGADEIDLSHYKGIDSFGDLEINQKGDNTVITLLDGDKIILGQFTATNLDGTDFQF